MQDLTLRPIGPSVLRITQEEQHKEKPEADDPFGRPPYQDNTRLFSVMSYIPLLWLVGLLADPHNEKVRYHVNQGIIFNIFYFSVSNCAEYFKIGITGYHLCVLDYYWPAAGCCFYSDCGILLHWRIQRIPRYPAAFAVYWQFVPGDSVTDAGE